ncbi:hypothetical protein F5Y09DRAFT_351537 [Xylaria sp. FL1042]|nr:hypothetical protein F5Y09DRAFT_351537 [Xylaria sp. FL1042]
MTKELRIFNSFGLARYYHSPPFCDRAGSIHDLQTEKKDDTEGRDAEGSIRIPVVLSIREAEEPLYTMQVSINLNNLRPYDELIHEILFAGRSIFRIYSEAYDDNFERIRDLQRAMLNFGCVYFIWDFAPQIHFTESGHTIPRYGKTDAACLSPEELVEYFRIAHTGRIKYILIRLQREREDAIKPSLKDLGHLRQEKEEARGIDSKSPGALLEKGRKQTTPSQQQQPLPRQGGQASSSQSNTTRTEESFWVALLLSSLVPFFMVWLLTIWYILLTH